MSTAVFDRVRLHTTEHFACWRLGTQEVSMAAEIRPERQFTAIRESMSPTPAPLSSSTSTTTTTTTAATTTTTTTTTTTVMLRKLPLKTTNEAVRTMLLFAKDLQDAEIVPNEYSEDGQFATAVARFSSLKAASEAQAMLDGKPNTAGQANMVVEIVAGAAYTPGWRNSVDPPPSRVSAQSLSPPPPAPKASRFNGTFQSIEKISSPAIGSPAEPTGADGPAHMHSLFSPQSPVSNGLKERSRITGKSVIGEDGGDDETGELLKDPLAYMKNTNGTHPAARYQANLRMSTSAFNALSLNTSVNSPSPSSYNSPRSAIHAPAPTMAFSPGGNPYQGSSNQYLRHNYPPVNPADQNPPCNTLYVGNLPMDTSEDELKAMFSKQRGYKRLCFRTKQNGPMCFVEFEDVSFATKALNELYGASLHNSVKGGIRLSFSKNPLGVRSGQPGSTNPATPLSPGSSGMMSPMSPNGFSTANGPPPGLSVPPGLNMQHSMSPNIPNGQYTGPAFGIAGNPSLQQHNRNLHMGNGNGASHNGGIYPDYMLGR